MKTLTIMFSILIILTQLHAGEVTGASGRVRHALSLAGMGLEALEASGHKVLLGEVTGAGKRIEMDEIEWVIGRSKVLPNKEIVHIDFKSPSRGLWLEEVNRIEFTTQKLKASEIDAVVMRK